MFEFRLSPGQLREWRETLKKIEALAPKKKTARDRTKTTTTNSRAKVNDGRNGDDDDMEEKEMDEGSRRDRGDREKELGGDNGDSAGGAKDEERRPGGDVDDAAVAAAVAAVDALQRSGEVDAEKSGKSTESKSRPSAPSGPSDGPAGEEGVARKRGDGGPGSGRGGGPDVLRSGGVTPEVVLAAKTKGRFASQVTQEGTDAVVRRKGGLVLRVPPFSTSRTGFGCRKPVMFVCSVLFSSRLGWVGGPKASPSGNECDAFPWWNGIMFGACIALVRSGNEKELF